MLLGSIAHALAAGEPPKVLDAATGRGHPRRVKLHHIALGARQVATLADFYRDVLRLAEVRRHHHPDGSLRSVWLDLDGALLMIEQTTEPPRNVDGIGAGPFLLALRVEPEQRTDTELRLTEASCPIERRSEHSSYCRDPEGNPIAISAFPWP